MANKKCIVGFKVPDPEGYHIVDVELKGIYVQDDSGFRWTPKEVSQEEIHSSVSFQTILSKNFLYKPVNALYVILDDSTSWSVRSVQRQENVVTFKLGGLYKCL